MANELERKWIKPFVLLFRSLLLLDLHVYEILHQLKVNKKGYD